MKNALIRYTLAVAALLMFTSLSPAQDVTVKTPVAAKAAVDATKNSTKAAADVKAAGKARIIDINSAGEAELKAIPGIGDTYAAKIIAGRPYINKTQLKTRNILPAPVYEKVKDQVVAKQAVKKAVPVKK